MCVVQPWIDKETVVAIVRKPRLVADISQLRASLDQQASSPLPRPSQGPCQLRRPVRAGLGTTDEDYSALLKGSGAFWRLLLAREYLVPKVMEPLLYAGMSKGLDDCVI
jgi:hypothetical protein